MDFQGPDNDEDDDHDDNGDHIHQHYDLNHDYSNKEDDEESLHNDGNDYDDSIANLKDCNDYNNDDARVLVVDDDDDDDDDDDNNSVIASRHATYDKFYDGQIDLLSNGNSNDILMDIDGDNVDDCDRDNHSSYDDTDYDNTFEKIYIVDISNDKDYDIKTIFDDNYDDDDNVSLHIDGNDYDDGCINVIVDVNVDHKNCDKLLQISIETNKCLAVNYDDNDNDAVAVINHNCNSDAVESLHTNDYYLINNNDTLNNEESGSIDPAKDDKDNDNASIDDQSEEKISLFNALHTLFDFDNNHHISYDGIDGDDEDDDYENDGVFDCDDDNDDNNNKDSCDIHDKDSDEALVVQQNDVYDNNDYHVNDICGDVDDNNIVIVAGHRTDFIGDVVKVQNNSFNNFIQHILANIQSVSLQSKNIFHYDDDSDDINDNNVDGYYKGNTSRILDIEDIE